MVNIKFSPIFIEGFEKLENNNPESTEKLKKILEILMEIEKEIDKKDKLSIKEIEEIDGFDSIVDEGIVFSYDNFRLIGILKETEILFLGIVTLEELKERYLKGEKL